MKQKYFNWLESLAMGSNTNYHELCEYLHSIIFVPLMEYDYNRVDDGVELRYGFGYENDISQVIVSCELDHEPCSVLEMMVALAMKMDNIVTSNEGNMISEWVMVMFKSLHLDDFTDGNFNENEAAEIIDIFLEREYDRYGDGGLFYIPDAKEDMRKIEIWEQAMWFLSSHERR